MDKKVTWVDVIFLPVFAVSLVISYGVHTAKAGYAMAEYLFDPDAFIRRYGRSPEGLKIPTLS